ncbi:MAG: hypothetical protein ACYDH6_14965 [Acidimicrobiales bacterium]
MVTLSVALAVTTPARAGANAPANPTYPRTPACSMDTTGPWPGLRRICRFTATTRGGWWSGYTTPPGQGPSIGVRGVPLGLALDSGALVRVTRGQVTATYRSDHYGSGCANAIIEPGDLVEVELDPAPHPPMFTPGDTYEVGAGYQWGCDGPHG